MNYKLCFFACALNLFYYVPNLLATPMIGGEEDSFNSYKYHVFIKYKFDSINPNSAKRLCGGSIINERHILSIAHPFLKINNGHFTKVLNPKSNGIIVLAGTSEEYGPGIITFVDTIFIPGVYNEHRYADISVLKLSTYLGVESNRDSLEIIPMERGNYPLEVFVNENALMHGFDCDATAKNKRHSLALQMTPKESCPEFNYAICAIAVDTSHKGTCSPGDGGSPIVFANTVIGVLFEVELQAYGRPPNMLFTRTSTFYRFIENAMSEIGDHSYMYILRN